MKALIGILLVLLCGGLFGNLAFYYAWASSFPNASSSCGQLSSVFAILSLISIGYGVYLFVSAMLPSWRRYYERALLLEAERNRKAAQDNAAQPKQHGD